MKLFYKVRYPVTKRFMRFTIRRYVAIFFNIDIEAGIKKHPKAWGTPGVLAILLTYFMKSALEWATLN
ncbi:hypothetical protein [Sphingobacterium thalpophilum]|uniref:Uncharacterized protein n=1 Tax=Sphingobacterium thalpophilum TaxID=259 RepID=A0A4U9W7X8_9SPHI|nr:hypothetical protein [Sphingobacterium thalpophilum]VTR54971.1 Uncharacterised protein [Sphingobacterium thalpophilum]